MANAPNHEHPHQNHHDHGEHRDDHGEHGHDHGEHGHDHGEHGHDHAKNAGEQRLRAALGLLFCFTVVEAAGGFWANSIALLAEAAHMLADCASLLLAIIAIRAGQRPASADRTYGHHRYQTLAAYTNGLTLLALTAWVVIEAARRLMAPPQVNGGLMLGIAAVGGIANLAAFIVLSGAGSLNERGARAHVLSDLLGSGAAMAAAGVILAFGWLSADPLLSIGVSVLIFRSGWQVTRESAHVLLEGTPGSFNAQQVQEELTSLSGVSGIHHVHAWSLTGEAAMVTLHADLYEGADRQQTLAAIVERLRLRFGVEHATVQLEEGECADFSDPENCHELDAYKNPKS
jgi:cobalt-zinc-cadmium efflux system protein